MSAEVQQQPRSDKEAKRQSWSEYGKEKYNQQYESWMPWVEDFYLRWFTKDNKASYTAKDNLDKTKVTGIQPVNKLQDGVNETLAGQVGQGGLFQPVGDSMSKEGINRAERQGKDDKGSYGPGAAGSIANPVANGAKSAGGAVMSGGQAVAGSVGGLFGGNKNQEGQK